MSLLDDATDIYQQGAGMVGGVADSVGGMIGGALGMLGGACRNRAGPPFAWCWPERTSRPTSSRG
ncbi:Uncharacterised protein [Chromobacterium violaceum]|uniref:Uncharacterized protein n=1 Tax=Chromobacterium violaceum TaxID=536 RepID=A0A447T959_CHRVL|nr:Uncharacterised protein [Chromobacterium violaceum]